MKFHDNHYRFSATDLGNHLACHHLTNLNASVARGEKKAPAYHDPMLAILQERGQEHEDAYVAYLQKAGRTVVDLTDKPASETLIQMKNGADVIQQASLGEDGWGGIADLLVRVDTKSALGNWSYEVYDTKLSQVTRAATVLQLSLYSDILTRLQGLAPHRMHVIKPGNEFDQESLLCSDFMAYYRLVKKQLSEFITQDKPATYPEPVTQCEICRWWQECDKRRREDDHLCFIAGIRTGHIAELEKNDVTTLTAFAEKDKPLPGRPEKGSLETFDRVHKQARIQLRSRREKKLLYELLPFEEDKGFARLPEPSKGDIFFDIEGDPFYGDGGIEYLLGVAFLDGQGHWDYKPWWSLNWKEEKKAYTEFMDFVMDRLEKFPDLHIYHYAPYEPSAVKRLMLRHAARETEVDELLRGEKFVDLHAVARQGIRAGVESYSLKDLEKFTSYQRKVDLWRAGEARQVTEYGLEMSCIDKVAKDDFITVEGYNRDDCFATLALRDWLEERRKELIGTGVAVPRPPAKDGAAGEKTQIADEAAQKLIDALIRDLPDDRNGWNDDQKAKWLLAHLVNYFRREDKCKWWEFFSLQEMEQEDALEERHAITGLQFVQSRPEKKSVVETYSFPPQEVSMEEGDPLFEMIKDGERAGTVFSIDSVKGILEVKRSSKSELNPLYAVFKHKNYATKVLSDSLMAFAQSVVDGKADSPGAELLFQRGPKKVKLISGSLKGADETASDAAVRLASEISGDILAIQGPPGSGKTFTGARMIIDLVQKGKRIGVTAVSHSVIHNLLRSIQKLAKEKKIPVHLGHKGDEDWNDGIALIENSADAQRKLDAGYVIGGTAWLWSGNDMEKSLDYLFVDEAGQISLAMALAVSRAAKNIILLGDPQQLEQPQQGAHPEGADIAALNHMLKGRKTIAEDQGIFLDETWRLSPKICHYTSELFYESRLQPRVGLEKQVLTGNKLFEGSGLFIVPVEHQGNQNKADEEVDAIEKLVNQLLQKNSTWVNEKGESKQMTTDDILIVAPYNAQVSALKDSLPQCRIGTVDKFQGQEAAVVVYSMTSSSPLEAPRGMSFLYNSNRLNVATSRARCACILVASAALFEPDCRTVDQIRWANAVCRFKEMSEG